MKINLKTVLAAAVVFTLTAPIAANAAIKTNRISDDKIAVSYSTSDLDTAAGKLYLEAEVKRAA